MINENKLAKVLVYTYCRNKDCGSCLMNNNKKCELVTILKILDELKEV